MTEPTTSWEEVAKGILETQEQIADAIKTLTEAPNFAAPKPAEPVLKGVDDQTNDLPVQKFMSPEARMELASTLRTKSTAELLTLFSLQARKQDTGIPLDHWLSAAGTATQNGFEGVGQQMTPDVRRALDTSGAAALIRQDLEPLLYEIYVRLFPAYDRFGKEPANGLVHAFNKITAYGDAQFMPELGTVTDDVSTYERATTNVAILATRRGISLKSQFAVMAGGMNYNPEQLELQGGLRAIAHKMQKTIFGGQAADSGGLETNELGPYDANGFTGLRSTLNTVRAVDVDPATNPDTSGNIRRAVDAAVIPIIQNGGLPSIMWSEPTEKNTFNEQQDDRTRIVVPNQINIGVGVTASGVNTLAGELPWGIVPGDSIYKYTDGGSTLRRDLYILDESSISLPYLGTAGPTVLDIPIGISGQLTRLFIIFLMNGMAVKVPQWSNKVRIKVTA
jgi:hypothetical protein